MISRALTKMSTRKCRGTCGDEEFHTGHLTWIGKQRYGGWWFFHVSRRIERNNVAHWVARHLPARVLYWAVIVAAVKAEPNRNPGEATALDMLKATEVED